MRVLRDRQVSQNVVSLDRAKEARVSSFADDAIEWRRERDRREPLKRDLAAERRAMIRQFLIGALEPAADDLASCLMSLDNANDVGAVYHFRRVVACVNAVAGGFRGLAE
jgi:hypothetical protein